MTQKIIYHNQPKKGQRYECLISFAPINFPLCIDKEQKLGQDAKSTNVHRYIFDEEEILKWLATHETHPITQNPVTELVFDTKLFKEITEFTSLTNDKKILLIQQAEKIKESAKSLNIGIKRIGDPIEAFPDMNIRPQWRAGEPGFVIGMVIGGIGDVIFLPTRGNAVSRATLALVGGITWIVLSLSITAATARQDRNYRRHFARNSLGHAIGFGIAETLRFCLTFTSLRSSLLLMMVIPQVAVTALVLTAAKHGNLVNDGLNRFGLFCQRAYQQLEQRLLPNRAPAP